jgi:hypothetical protein
MTDADGNFQVTRLSTPNVKPTIGGVTDISVSTIAAGTHTLTVTDGTNSGTATYTENPRLRVLQTHSGSPTDNIALTSGYPDRAFTSVAIVADGFAASEGVSYSFTNAFTANPTTCTTGTTTSTAPGECVSTTNALNVAITSGGSKTVSATGGTSGLVASSTFTINPLVAFYTSQSGATVFSFIGSTPTSVLMEGYGFTASSTIAANSITIGGVATSHGSISIGSDGTFGVGAGNHTIVSPSSSVPLGPTSVVVQGNTFNWANGNIIAGAATDSNGQNIPSTTNNLGVSATHGARIAFGWGSPIISTIVGSASSTATVVTDKSSYMPNTQSDSYSTNAWGVQQDATVTLIGSGFTSGDSGIGTPSCSNCGSLTWAATTADARGAFWAQSTAGFGDAGQTVTTGPQTVSISVSSTHVANTVPPSFTIQPWLFLSGTGQSWSSAISNGKWTPAVIDFSASASQLAMEAHGFKTTTALTFTIAPASGCTTCTPGTITESTGSSTTGSTGAVTGVQPSTLSNFDLAAGTYMITASDGQNSATDMFMVRPLVNTAGGNNALSDNTDKAGSTTSLRTGTTFGVHGLKASTGYTVYFGIGSGATSAATFTSTSTGGIPLPGVQFSIPSGAVGQHILAIRETATGNDSLFNVVNGAFLVSSQSLNPASSISPLGATAIVSQYGDSIFRITASILVGPTVANVGSTVFVSGSGLSPSTTYYVSVAANSAHLSVGSIQVATFTTDASGNIPTTASFPFPNTPADTSTGPSNNPESGTQYDVFVSTGTQFINGANSGVGTFVLQAAEFFASSTASASNIVSMTATGLAQTTTYDVIFNYALSTSGNSYTGTTVGAFTTNALGAANAGFTVPATTATGTYVVQLVRLGSSASTFGVLAIPASLTVTNALPNAGCQDTTCMTVSGTPTVTTLNGQKTIQATYINNSNATQTAITYAVVHNANGQTVAYTTATITPAASGGTSTAYLVLFGLAPGTYSVTLFTTTTGGVAISTSTTVSVTI